MFFYLLLSMSIGEVLTLHAGDSTLSHCLTLRDVGLDEASILLEQQTDAEQQHADCKYGYAKKKYPKHRSLLSET